ncbi:MAG TPA: aminopeptidase P family protein [Phycisphaerae bacterium]|nr:aminopeptidase P family protein [Phycisphaerae bacterium]
MSGQNIHPPKYIQNRCEALTAALEKQKLPALLISSYVDVSYVTGFEGDDSWVIFTPEKVWLISDSRYSEQIQRECPWVVPVIRKKGFGEELMRISRREKISLLGVQAETLTLLQFGALQRAARPARLRLKPVDNLVIELRHIKDAHEISLIEEAIVIAEQAFEIIRKAIRTGMTENDLAGLLVYEMRRRGASDASFQPIVAVGANGSLPHYRPGNVKIGHNTPLLIDWGALYRAYRSDLTRMLFLGKIPEKIREIYRIVLDAQQTAIAAVRPGLSGKKIDKIARDIIAKAGYGPAFGHSLGHGIGRDIHEQISLSPRSKVILKPGMIVTVEPGIYLPGIGGVRIEDDVLVTESGCRMLSHLPKDINSARL